MCYVDVDAFWRKYKISEVDFDCNNTTDASSSPYSLHNRHITSILFFLKHLFSNNNYTLTNRKGLYEVIGSPEIA